MDVDVELVDVEELVLDEDIEELVVLEELDVEVEEADEVEEVLVEAVDVVEPAVGTAEVEAADIFSNVLQGVSIAISRLGFLDDSSRCYKSRG